MEPEAESVGPSLPELEVTEVESEAPADVAATHGPDAVAVAEAEGEVDLDTVVPEPQRAAEDGHHGRHPDRDCRRRGAFIGCGTGPEPRRLYTGGSHG